MVASSSPSGACPIDRYRILECKLCKLEYTHRIMHIAATPTSHGCAAHATTTIGEPILQCRDTVCSKFLFQPRRAHGDGKSMRSQYTHTQMILCISTTKLRWRAPHKLGHLSHSGRTAQIRNAKHGQTGRKGRIRTASGWLRGIAWAPGIHYVCAMKKHHLEKSGMGYFLIAPSAFSFVLLVILFRATL